MLSTHTPEHVHIYETKDYLADSYFSIELLCQKMKNKYNKAFTLEKRKDQITLMIQRGKNQVVISSKKRLLKS